MDRTCKSNVDRKGYFPEYLQCGTVYVNFEPPKTVFQIIYEYTNIKGRVT